MSIKIDAQKCVGCTKCKSACPGNLIAIDEHGRAYSKYPHLCWGCTACLKECQFSAIRYFLGADIGGKGTTLRTQKDGDLLHWHMEQPDGQTTTITINRNDSNQY